MCELKLDGMSLALVYSDGASNAESPAAMATSART